MHQYSKKITSRKLMIIFVLALATILRLYRLGEIPVGLYWDEVAMLADAKSLLVTGKDLHGSVWLQAIFPSYGDFKMPAYIWLATISASIFGVSNFSLRLVSALAGIGTVLLGGGLATLLLKRFNLGKKDQNQSSLAQAGIWTMLVLAISPWSVLFSRTAFEGHLSQFILGVSIWLLFKKPKSVIIVILSAGLGALASYTYYSTRFVWPVVLVVSQLLILAPWKEFSGKKKIRSTITQLASQVLLPLAVFAMLFLPMLRSPWYDMSQVIRLDTDSILKNEPEILQSNHYRELAGNTRIDRVFFHRHWLTARELLQNYGDHLDPNYLFLTGDQNLRHGTGEHGLFLLPMLIFLPAGLYYLAKKSRPTAIVLIVWWFVGLLPASVPETTPHALRSLNSLLPASIILGTGATAVFQYLQHLPKLAGKISSGVLLVTLLLFASQFLYHYFAI